MYSSIPDKLQSLYHDGYKLVIFTNECNIERWKNKRQVAVDSKIGRLNSFIETVKVPMQVFIACGLPSKANITDADPFRKPNPGMWRLMEKHFNSGIVIDVDESFYVGDAAGRELDHSDADIKFAEVVKTTSPMFCMHIKIKHCVIGSCDVLLHDRPSYAYIQHINNVVYSSSSVTERVPSQHSVCLVIAGKSRVTILANGLKFYVPEEFFDT
ncbi:hypothetical protein Ahy_B06g085568 isoform C [Arachis hypogaea]|uniref:Uncharacterized protein n=1 Tax=Arachis hypogaea TaxID=3818 RepID=A0A444YUZ5_ARAHY|nr:hypothetical protein Ahy_B06g085568 isoform C [Arachis hypogaea]